MDTDDFLSHTVPVPYRPRRRTFTVDCHRHGVQTGETWQREDTCPACAEEAAAQEQAERLAAKRRSRAADRRVDLALPARFRAADLGSLPCSTSAQRAAVAACQAFVDTLPNTGAGLFLLGPPGTGKSTMAAACCLAAIDQREVSAAMVTQRELIRAIRATWDKSAMFTEAEVLGRFVGAQLLALDDAGIGYGSDSELVQLLDVIDARYQRQRPTLVCSNLTAPMLAKALGDRIFDRLREGARFVVCDWPSYRGGAA